MRYVCDRRATAASCALILVGLVSAASLAAEPPGGRAPDGAPGENRAPGADPAEFVQKPQAEQEPEAEPAPRAERDDGPLERKGSDTAPAASRTEASAAENDLLSLDSVDFQAPFSKSKQTEWTRIKRAAASGEWDRVFERLDRFAGRIDRPADGDLMLLGGTGQLRSRHLRIAALMANLPERVREARSRQTAAAGRRLVEEAIQKQDLRELNRLAARLFGTRVGYRAADQLATLLIDRGDFAMASEWLDLLSDTNADFVSNPDWRRRAKLVAAIRNISSNIESEPSAAERPVRLARRLVPDEPEPITDRPVPGGNARRHSRTKSDVRPVMIRRWSFPTMSHRELSRSVTELVAELQQRRTPAVPAGVPLFINGKVVTRTFRGLEVLDAETGDHLWSASQRSSVEQLLNSAHRGHRPDSELRHGMTPLFSADTAVDRSGGPIGQFLFQNAAHGLVSSDGRSVYFLEDHPVFTLGRTSIRTGRGRSASPGLLSATTNRLKAFDLSTGRQMWQAGGAETREPFAPELAGWFFLGAPLPDRGDLFVVGQRENVVRLFCLDPESGQPRWSQLLAFSEKRLERNLNRRLQSVQVSIAHGVVVCPTTVGWLVGVDRATGTLLWAHRYSDRKDDQGAGTPGLVRTNRGPVEVANVPIGESWVGSAPIITGDRVVVCPSQPLSPRDRTTQIIDCVDLFTGERLWSQPRDDSLYAIGLNNRRVALVGAERMTILDPDGSVRSSVKYGEQNGPPSGRGILAGDAIWLPLLDRTLIRIDLTAATVTDRFELPPRQEPLGNLATYEGLLISHAPGSISAWELEGTLQSQLASVRESGRSEQADLLEARLALVRKEYGRAINMLVSSLSTEPRSSVPGSIQEILVQAAFAHLQADPQSCLELLRQLEPIELSDRVKLQQRALKVEALRRLNRAGDAFAVLLEIAEAAPAGLMDRIDNPAVQVSVDAWMSGLVPDVWKQLSSAERDRFDAPIQRLLNSTAHDHSRSDDAQTAAANLASKRRLQRRRKWFRFLLASDQPGRADTEGNGRKRDAEAEATGGNNAADASKAAGTSEDAEDAEDAENAEDGEATDQATEAGRESDRSRGLLKASATEAVDEAVDWGDIELEMVRSAATLARPSTVSVVNLSGPLGRLRLEVNQSETGTRRLSFHDRRTDSIYWTATLRSGAASQNVSRQTLIIARTGQLLAVFDRGALNLLSLPDRQVLWTQRVETLDNARRASSQNFRPLQRTSEWLKRLRPGSGSPLPATTSDYVCSRGTRSLTVFDTSTGERRWKLEPVGRSLRVFGTRSTVYLTNPDGTITEAFRAIDGMPVPPEPLLRSTLRSGAAVAGISEDVIVFARLSDNGSGSRQVVIEAVQPGSGDILWSESFDRDARIGELGETRLAVMAPRGRFQILDLVTGELQKFDPIPVRLRLGNPQYTVFSDNELVYVVLTRGASAHSQSPGLSSVFINGHLIAFDQSTGRQQWHRGLDEQHLIVEKLDQLPFLITMSHSREFLLTPSGRRRLVVLDRKDGRELISVSNQPGQSGFHSVLIDSEEQHVDLLSGSERLRLQARPRQPAP